MMMRTSTRRRKKGVLAVAAAQGVVRLSKELLQREPDGEFQAQAAVAAAAAAAAAVVAVAVVASAVVNNH